ncbi:Vps28 protein [Candida orthopsilosis Co 90-125]|uniref:Vacuolar protein sorting-associated protein 28 n=1 Tax=Candida orthopsilosis (strain 90-125) TaxID=1136231 RepID=H8X2U8_CANO9|nr:Vps28 protein [Candida orthopsilosis Co 90-125]CCG25645.1 Vps28 protein [Candida orthopsilosis Co 90-125]
MSHPPEYAPTASTSFTISSKSSKFNQELTRSSLIKSPSNKSIYNSLAEISSILLSIEMLENSFIKDYITDKEKYTSTAYRLIYQYQIIIKGFDELKLPVLRELMPDLSSDLSNFLDLFTSKFNLNCTQAVNRLLSGVPSTIDHVSGASDSGINTGNKANARLIAEITGNFITCMDAVKLNYKTRDQLHPLLSDLVVNLNEFNESIEFNGKSKLINWLIKINNSEKELSQEDSDSFLNDLDIAYKGFYTSLESH